jgi:ASC-1-like (ASCH) protein
MDHELVKILAVEELEDFNDEYVYDVIMADDSTPWFFANDMLVHNSCYFKTGATNKEEAIEIADRVAVLTNKSFPAFMRESFNCQPGFDDLIKAGREIVGVRGIFQAKKKYMIKVVDLEGFAVDKLKTQGSEIKKADTPKIIQKFLKETVDKILEGESYASVADFVINQRKKILRNEENTFKLGVAKQVNNLGAYQHAYDMTSKGGVINPETGRKITVPGHVRAALNYNKLVGGWSKGEDVFEGFDPGSKLISSGDKILIFSLSKNEFDIETIGLPAELSKFPQWVTENFKIDIK